MEDEEQRVVGIGAEWGTECEHGSVQMWEVWATENDVLPTTNEECG